MISASIPLVKYIASALVTAYKTSVMGNVTLNKIV